MTQKLALGNAAIAEGALESGVEVVTGYPGTPSSELIQYLAEIVIAEQLPTYVEWSVNEKVAMDVAVAAAWGGKRTLVTMKMAGLNVASDTLINIAYKGVRGGLVVYVADDPGTHAGCTEQDSRYYSLLSRVPILDAADPADAHGLIKFAFAASEAVQIPIILRATTNVAHTMGVISPSPHPGQKREFQFQKNIPVYTTILADRAEQHRQLFVKHEKLQALLDEQGYNRLALNGTLAVVASGVAWTYLQEAISMYDLKLSTLKLDCENPWPEGKVQQLIEQSEKILVLEEQDPIVENLLIKTRNGSPISVLGKNDGTLPRVDEYDFELVVQAIEKLVGRQLSVDSSASKNGKKLGFERPKRNLTFCIGCQHRATYYLIGKAIRKLGFKKNEVIVTGDIGCTSLGVFKPLETIWTEVTMGASISLAHGFKIAGSDKPVIATLGDSTFFHSGIPPLINAIQHGSDLTVIVMDNSWTAMTGFQPNPNTGLNALNQPATRISVQQIVEALGVYWKIVKPYEVDNAIETIVDAVKRPGVKVIIAQEECTLQRVRRQGGDKPYWVNPETCRNCHTCTRTFACPAISEGEGYHIIDRITCIGCGVCAHVCPFDAIEEAPVQ
jgi:indolepyruvate ferredoxin oxidoreductase alpha subunit